MMEADTLSELVQSLRPWFKEALQHIKEYPVQYNELTNALFGDGEVRIVFYARANVISIEAIDSKQQTCTEIFRHEILPPTDTPNDDMRKWMQ